MKIKLKTIPVLSFVGIGLIMFFTYQNNALSITNYSYKNSRLPEGFHGYRIVQVSDLHNKNYHGMLIKKVKKSNPDIIIVTGDLIDRRSVKINTAISFIQQAAEIAPIFYVSGNHEQLSGRYDRLKEELRNLDVQIIDNCYTKLNRNGDEIGLMGMADPAIERNKGTYFRRNSSQYIESSLKKLFNRNRIGTDFNILLSHRPEPFNVYRDMNIDLVFSGHAHGGQIRIPFIGGLFAPSQGLFPKYTDGIHKDGKTSIVVSRGLGNSIFPFRVFNRPELVVVTFYSE